MILAASAYAQSYTINRLGNTDFVNGSNGYQGYGQQLGETYFYNDSYGSGYANRLGNTTFYNYTPNYIPPQQQMPQHYGYRNRYAW